MPALPPDHPTAMAFIDESGVIAHDRFFVLGCLVTDVAPALARSVQIYRDRVHFYDELHFARITGATQPHHEAMIRLLARAFQHGQARFNCCVADRTSLDVVKAFGGPYGAYEGVATRLLVNASARPGLISAIADNYSAPDGVTFEENVQAAVNSVYDELRIASLLRLDSRSSDLLQLADLLTSVVGFEFRIGAGLASHTSRKGRFMAWAREHLGCRTFTRSGNPAIRVDAYAPVRAQQG